MTGLDGAGRASLERLVGKARRLLEEDLAGIAEGRFGIHRDGTLEEETSIRLEASGLVERREIVAIVMHLRSEGETESGAVERVIREVCFTHLNRLVAIRVAESIGLLPASLADGKASRGFRDVLEVSPLLRSDAYGGYWSYLRLCGDELAADAPVLFDPRNPLLVLAPSPTALDQLVGLFAEPALASVWSAPDTLGWVYQFFNTGDERRQMREAGAPRNSRELAVRNQFFTPRYVVDFLVQNSLGRRLLEADPDSGLIEDLPLLLDPPRVPRRPLALDEVLILDPACGSGHFLLGAYDLLEKAWARVGVPPADAAARILPCLHGIDIDPRCAQVASAALMLRARRACLRGDLPRPTVITARALPRDEEAWRAVLAELPRDRQRLLRALDDALQQAPVLGPLLKVEERLASEIKRVLPEAESGAGPLAALWHRADVLAEAEADVLRALQGVADEASSTPAERLLAAEAGDAIRFVEAMRGRYDVVLMNPPFGEPVPETKDYLRAAYSWIPWKDYNLLAAFVGRGIELVREGGYLGAITSRAGLFLITFEAWRREVLLSHELLALADLGAKVMEGAQVEASAYVVSGARRSPGKSAVFISLLKDTDRPTALAEACRSARGPAPSARVFRVAPEELESIPGAPLAYWVAPSVRRLFTDLPPLEGSGAEVRQGLATADDFRFVRAVWEVNPARIGRTREETFHGKGWVPFAKGGEYSPYYADTHLVVDWEEDGRRIRAFEKAVVRNAKYYFRPGLTWPERTVSAFGPQVLPAGCVISVVGPGLFPLDESARPVLAVVLNARIMRVLVDGLVPAGEETESGGVPARHYGVGLIQRLPWVGRALGGDPGNHLGTLSRELIGLRAALDQGEETARRFLRPGVLCWAGSSFAERRAAALDGREAAVVRAIDLSFDGEQTLHRALELTSDAERYLDEGYGPHPASYLKDSLSPDEQKNLVRLYRTSIEKVIDEVVETQGGSRTVATKSYFVDRRLEVLAHVFRRHPELLVETRRKFAAMPPEEPRRCAQDLLSYHVGCALGRWDVRIGRNPSLAPPLPDLLDPVPVCPPGMLLDRDALPAAELPPGYPMELPPDRVLLDEPGHRWDIEAAIRQAAEILFEDPEDVLAEIETILGRALREHLRRQFFKDHLTRYSKSRRQAPIYWHLSVPSRTWGVWVYAPMVTRETLFAVARHAARRQASGRQIAAGLRADREAGGRGRSPRELIARIAEEEDLGNELERFGLEVERVAGLGWEPDLDDGLILCAAPLAQLFPAWAAASEERRNLKAGSYRWATVARWADSL